ncbi:MAG: magnesium transporter, partial [Desulfobacula sp.]|nr:magnesium transporter [Desulfobacula sp.]
MHNEQILILTVSIKRLLRRGATKQLVNIIKKTHMADLSIVFQELSRLNREKFFQVLKDPEEIGILFS